VAAFVLNPAGLAELLASTVGPVAVDLTRRSIRVESQAKLNASGRPGPNVRTGRLRSSITHRLGVDAQGLYGEIGTNVAYGFWVEMGSDRAPPYPYLRPALSAAG
jgi:hypothetical protein